MKQNIKNFYIRWHEAGKYGIMRDVLENMKKKENKKIALYRAEDWFKKGKRAKPVGWACDPDAPGPLMVPREVLFSMVEKQKGDMRK